MLRITLGVGQSPTTLPKAQNAIKQIKVFQRKTFTKVGGISKFILLTPLAPQYWR